MATEDIIRRIEHALGTPGIAQKLAQQISPTDLQSLMLAVYKARSSQRTPSDLLADYERNRFVAPSAVDAEKIQQVESSIRAHLPSTARLLDLSPVCPLGTSSIIAGVSQDWSVATARNTEVVSDATNVLALECALQRRLALKGDAKSQEAFHYYTSHRLLRPQFYDDPDLLAHFRLFHSCSAGRDSGNLQFETESILTHASAYLATLEQITPTDARIEFLLTDFHDQDRNEHLQNNLLAHLAATHAGVQFSINELREAGRGYYRDLCFHINVHLPDKEPIQLADGGSVDWTQQLLGSAKERLVSSAISSERMSAMLT
ncbi:MAG: hypothetical protein ACR2PZ_19035 [Pseudomonadales bacterium]